jgi:hypothetical protein
MAMAEPARDTVRTNAEGARTRPEWPATPAASSTAAAKAPERIVRAKGQKLLGLSVPAALNSKMASLAITLLALGLLTPGASALALGSPGQRFAARVRPSTALGAGFGKTAGGGGAAVRRGPLNAKRQWDKYADLSRKGASTAEVAVRKDATSDWRAVGRVCAADCTALAAAARQRSLIAEHGKRLHLSLMQLGKAPVQVGCRTDAAAEYEVVGKAEDSVGAGAEYGFEGIADPPSGYYCHYKDGKLSQSGSAATARDASE